MTEKPLVCNCFGYTNSVCASGNIISKAYNPTAKAQRAFPVELLFAFTINQKKYNDNDNSPENVGNVCIFVAQMVNGQSFNIIEISMKQAC